MSDLLLVVTFIIFLLIGFMIVKRFDFFIKENKEEKHSDKKKGTVHDLRDGKK